MARPSSHSARPAVRHLAHGRSAAQARGTGGDRRGSGNEKTPAERLYEAARDGDVAALDALLPDATAEQLNEEHQYENDLGFDTTATPLFAATCEGHEAIVRRLISGGADVARGCSEGFTPLMAAAAMNRYGCAVALLEAGADVNHEVSISDNKIRCRALHMAVHIYCSPEFVRLLLTHGADVDAVARDLSYESSPLSLAFDNEYNHPDISDPDARKRYFLNSHSVAFMLLRAGADVSHLFEERPHLATEQQPHPCEATQERPHPSYETLPLVRILHTDRHRTYVEAVHAAGGFASYARARQCQLLTIKLLARGHGRLNLPEAMIPTIVSFWDKPWVPSFDAEGRPV